MHIYVTATKIIIAAFHCLVIIPVLASACVGLEIHRKSLFLRLMDNSKTVIQDHL